VDQVKAPDRALVVLALIALVQGLALIGYAVFDMVEAVRVGTTGPEEVSSAPALLLLIVTTAAFGLGLLLVAGGWWRARRWARAPFLVAQLIFGLIGYELSQAEGAVERAVGYACVLVAIGGLALSFAPAVARAIDDPDSA
jgi:hypothetical protein